jgi:membrane glycosyltransferase
VELVSSSVMAPILLMFQTRSVLQVLFGIDGGWPVNNRGDGRLTLRQGVEAGGWIAMAGMAGLAVVHLVAPGLVLWLLPVALPMCLAPVVIAWTSQDSRTGLMAVPSELAPSPVIGRHADILRAWTGMTPLPAPADPAGAAAPIHA